MNKAKDPDNFEKSIGVLISNFNSISILCDSDVILRIDYISSQCSTTGDKPISHPHLS